MEKNKEHKKNNKKDNNLHLERRFIKCYKKSTLAVFSSFVLTFLLLTTMVVLIHTNHRIENIQQKTILSPSDCSVDELSTSQIEELINDKDITRVAVTQMTEKSYQRNKQSFFMEQGDKLYTTMTSSILEGRLANNQGEVAAEKWVLLNLGIEPKCGQEFEILDIDTGEPITLKLVGILSDMSRNKKYGVISLYTALDTTAQTGYTAYIQLKSDVNYDSKMGQLKEEMGISKKQIKVCPAKENLLELYSIDVKIISVILLVCMIVFYGIYRITLVTREKQYGILRAIGMKRQQLQRMILSELYQIYLISIPVGIAAGLLVSLFIVNMSGDLDTIVYFYNEQVEFQPVIPVSVLFISTIIVTVLIGAVGYCGSRRVVKATPMDAISGMHSDDKKSKTVFRLRRKGSKTGTIFAMGGKYIFRDRKTSCSAILTICLGIVLFTGLAYKSKTVEIYRSDTKEMWYLNGQYAMGVLNFQEPTEGVNRKSAKEMEALPDIISMKTASGIPIRVVDEDNVKRNDSYYDKLNDSMQEIYGYEAVGFDGKNQVYKSILYGYNSVALKELEKHVLSGKTNLETLEEDEIILSILRMDDTKQNDLPGSFREGTPLMQYKVGDKVLIKYRKDLNTGSIAYDDFSDKDVAYVYKTYRVAAIVSFSYMLDCKRTVYPLLITKDEEIQKIAPNSAFQNIYVDGINNLSDYEQTELEQQLIEIGNQSPNISTRSIISEIKQNQMFYHKQLIYIYGIAIVSFLLVLINIINNLKYRMQTRTSEICMLRAIGMSVAMIKRMLLFENMVLGVVAIVMAFALSQPVLRYLYRISDMQAMGHSFQYNYGAFAVISGISLLICGLLTVESTKHKLSTVISAS